MLLKRFKYALQGLLHAAKNDFSFRAQIYLGLIVAGVVLLFFQPITVIEVVFLVLALFLILITELQNSALESALNKLHPERHHNIKHSKDMAAAAVLLAGLFLVLILLVIGLADL